MRTGGIELRIGDLLFALQKRWKIILSLTVVGLVFGLMLNSMTYIQSTLQTYEVKGSVAIATRTARGNFLGNYDLPDRDDFNLASDMADPVVYVMRSDRAMKEIIADLGLIGISPKDIQDKLTITQYNSTQILTMTLIWSTAEEGLSIWNGIVEEANKLLPDTLMVGNLAIINEPETQLMGVSGASKSIWMFLAVLGFAVGAGYAVMELLMHPTVNNVKDIEPMFGLENIGLIPHDSGYFKRKTSILERNEASTAIVQSYATAAYILRNRLGTKDAHHCLYVTSAVNKEGRTSVAANLAIQLSDMELHTLLIDFDTHNPSLGSLFFSNVDYSHSLNALYRGDINEAEAITTLTGYLDILPMVREHNAVAMDGAIEALFKRLIEKYDYVIIDAPPVGRESEALSLNQVANSVLYVLGYDNATIPDIQSALDKLDKTGIRVVGCVVNDVRSSTGFSAANKEDQPKKLLNRRKKKASQQEEDFAAPQEDEMPKTVGKSSRRGRKDKKRGSDQPGEQQSEAKPTSAATPPAGKKNVMEDLLAEHAKAESKTDSEVMSSLLKMSLTGEWKDKDQKGQGETPHDEPTP